jgi:hypothetical protein
MGIREEMPLLTRHEGTWEGEYIWVDGDAKVIDRHKSRIQSSFPTEGKFDYYQINTYTWPDGRVEENHFPATYKEKELWFDTERIYGHAWEVDSRTIILTWTRKDNPTGFFYEMIQINDENNERARIWQWFEGGVCTRRTLITESRVS